MFIKNLIKFIFWFKKFSYSQAKSLSLRAIKSNLITLWKNVYIWKNNTFIWCIYIDDYSYLSNHWTMLHWSDKVKIIIWKYCSIAPWVSIISHNNHNCNKLTTYPINNSLFSLSSKSTELWWDINIWNDVWIWKNAIILPNIRIWNWVVIWAWSIVTKDVPHYAIVWWNPARIIKYRFNNDIIQALLDSKWWDWDIQKIQENYNLEFLKKK